jgi:antitoxin component YwqK of YwqJK toxin-antitoxin module
MHTRLVLLAFLFVSLISCKETYEERIISVHPNNIPAIIEYYKSGDTLGYPAKLVRFYINGEKREEFHLKDGQKHGTCTMWHVNGKKRSKSNYFEDTYHGEYIEWFDNGIKNYEGYYEKGEISGTWRFYNRDGSLQSETTY